MRRDIEVLKFINEFGFCDMPQLMARFGLKKTWMYEIMQRLVMVKLVDHTRILFGHGVFTLTSKGAHYTDLPPIDRIPKGQYDHHMMIVNVYIKLRWLYPEANWISERKLKRDKFFDGLGKRGHISDGILDFPDGKQIAVEVEMSVKGKNRIEKILKMYRAQLVIKEVWYFCSPEVINTLKALSAKMSFVKIINLGEFLYERK